MFGVSRKGAQRTQKQQAADAWDEGGRRSAAKERTECPNQRWFFAFLARCCG